jgi:hypothetical protein
VAKQQWYHLPLIDGPRERLSSWPGAIDGRLAPASDGRPANDPRLLAPPNETLARLLRDDSGRNAMPSGFQSAPRRAQRVEAGIGNQRSQIFEDEEETVIDR